MVYGGDGGERERGMEEKGMDGMESSAHQLHLYSRVTLRMR